MSEIEKLRAQIARMKGFANAADEAIAVLTTERDMYRERCGNAVRLLDEAHAEIEALRARARAKKSSA